MGTDGVGDKQSGSVSEGGGNSPNTNQASNSGGKSPIDSKHNSENTTVEWETRNSDGSLAGQPAPPLDLSEIVVGTPKASKSEKF